MMASPVKNNLGNKRKDETLLAESCTRHYAEVSEEEEV